MKNIVVKPKTIKDIQSNTRVLQAFNRNHKDDIFMNSKARNRKIVKVITCPINGSWLKNILKRGYELVFNFCQCRQLNFLNVLGDKARP